MKPGNLLLALSCVIAALFSFTSPARGQPSAPSRAASVLDSMPHARRIDQVALSPDGTEVAYIENGELAVLALSGGASHAISVEGKLPLREVAWSADGKQLAFLADLPGEGPSAQLWTAPVDGSDPVKRAELKGYAENPRFSPDGSKLAVLFIKDMPRVAGPLQPMTPLAGVIDEKIYEQRIATVDLRLNDLRTISTAVP
jgi:dipeptidyl aminopeptidase/acylaminoacyl peptidase